MPVEAIVKLSSSSAERASLARRGVGGGRSTTTEFSQSRATGSPRTSRSRFLHEPPLHRQFSRASIGAIACYKNGSPGTQSLPPGRLDDLRVGDIAGDGSSTGVANHDVSASVKRA